MAVVRLYLHVAPLAEQDAVVKPLVRMSNDAASGHFIALSTIYSIIATRPAAFVPYIKDFFLSTADAPSVRELKLRVIAKLVTRDNQGTVLKEFNSYLHSYTIGKVIDTIKSLGIMSFAVQESASTIVRMITPYLSHSDDDVVTECVVLLRQVVVLSHDVSQTNKIVVKLAQRVLSGALKAPIARASVVWLVGENIRKHANIAKIAPDFFRGFVKTFKTETPAVKAQVLVLGTKIWLNLEGEGAMADRFKAIFRYLMDLVRFDGDYDVRDQGRIIESALDRESAAFAALKAATLAEKPLPQHSDRLVEDTIETGTMSHVVGAQLMGYRPLASWPAVMPDATARDPPDEASTDNGMSDFTSDDETESDDGATASDSDFSSTSSAASSAESSSDDEPQVPRARPAPAPKRAAAAAPKVRIIVRGGAAATAAAKAKADDAVVSSMFTAPVKHVDPASAAVAADDDEADDEKVEEKEEAAVQPDDEDVDAEAEAEAVASDADE
jgi:AP-3 complex subunit beta